MVSVGFLIASLSQSRALGGGSGTLGTQAQFLAEAGIQDALIKIARDKDFTGSFSITSGSSSVAVLVTGGSPIIVVATSTVPGSDVSIGMTLQASVTLDADGKITSITKISL